MDKQQAENLIRGVFESAFDEAEYLRFVRELFNGQIDESDDRKFDLYGQYIPDSFKDSVRRYKRLGTYTDPDGHEIDLLVVFLKRESSLDRARTMQRNFAAYHLKRREKETAVIAYTTDERNDWRFSMVRREPVVTFSDAGNLIAKDELTPVRRYSFLVGQNEGSHTAQQQLFPILEDDKHDPTLERLEEAFNIETVTKEFFERYKNLFLHLKEELDRLVAKDKRLEKVFTDDKGENITANFAKKLLGQIVFLYFLQKKGWLGVPLNGKWGDGSKRFLQDLFNNKTTYDNFFNDVLEPLFYKALALENPDHIYKPLNVRIPFLNGGLFEPMNNYGWKETDININNDVFEEIFDTFDLYNFTVREDEPLEKEVAVDPEMLGKVFENLLEVTDRKSKGAFYTPREIVHYMCQESLINYLATALGDAVPRDDIATFIRFGELAVQNDIAKEGGTVSYKYQMPESIRTHAARLDEALASIKICDPAIGSGAFPVGMMQEIVKAREVLTTYIGEEGLPSPTGRGAGGEGQRTIYNFKRQAIQESIYGVDIDSGAIDIAKLRLWLSLVVDEDDYHHIKPLPNLDYKIVCGNSLLSVQKDLFNLELFQQLEKLKAVYFSETNPQEKQKQRAEIDTLIERLTGGHSTFDMQIYFSEVFHGNKGFDVVIGNPPYLRIQGIRQENPQLAKVYKDLFDSATGSFDLYVLFTEKGLSILNGSGQLNFIMPDRWTNAAFGKGLRQVVSSGDHAHKLISFGAHQVFNASTYTSLLWLTKQANAKFHYKAFNQDMLSGIQLANALTQLKPEAYNPIDVNELTEEAWVLTNRKIGEILNTMNLQSRKIGSIFSQIYVGLQTSSDTVYFLKHCKHQNNEITGFSDALKKEVTLEFDIVKPLLKGENVHRFVNLETDTYVLFPYKVQKNEGRNIVNLMPQDVISRKYPKAWQYLRDCSEILEGRERGKFCDKNWYRFGRNQGIFFEDSPKLVSPDISLGSNFAYDSTGIFYMTTTVYGYIKHNNVSEGYPFWLTLLNSKLMWFFIQQTGTVLANGYYRYMPRYVEMFPVPEVIDPKEEQLFATFANYLQFIRKHIDIKSSSHARDAVMVSYFEQIVDALVYELYFPEEIHGAGRNFIDLLQREKLPRIAEDADETEIRVLRQTFERLFKPDHPLRKSLFFLDSLELVRIIEGKA